MIIKSFHIKAIQIFWRIAEFGNTFFTYVFLKRISKFEYWYYILNLFLCNIIFVLEM